MKGDSISLKAAPAAKNVPKAPAAAKPTPMEIPEQELNLSPMTKKVSPAVGFHNRDTHKISLVPFFEIIEGAEVRKLSAVSVLQEHFQKKFKSSPSYDDLDGFAPNQL